MFKSELKKLILYITNNIDISSIKGVSNFAKIISKVYSSDSVIEINSVV